MYFIT